MFVEDCLSSRRDAFETLLPLIMRAIENDMVDIFKLLHAVRPDEIRRDIQNLGYTCFEPFG
jgi:hypothetical protein